MSNKDVFVSCLRHFRLYRKYTRQVRVQLIRRWLFRGQIWTNILCVKSFFFLRKSKDSHLIVFITVIVVVGVTQPFHHCVVFIIWFKCMSWVILVCSHWTLYSFTFHLIAFPLNSLRIISMKITENALVFNWNEQ